VPPTDVIQSLDLKEPPLHLKESSPPRSSISPGRPPSTHVGPLWDDLCLQDGHRQRRHHGEIHCRLHPLGPSMPPLLGGHVGYRPRRGPARSTATFILVVLGRGACRLCLRVELGALLWYSQITMSRSFILIGRL
jgi:hypothetical protein